MVLCESLRNKTCRMRWALREGGTGCPCVGGHSATIVTLNTWRRAGGSGQDLDAECGGRCRCNHDTATWKRRASISNTIRHASVHITYMHSITRGLLEYSVPTGGYAQ